MYPIPSRVSRFAAAASVIALVVGACSGAATTTSSPAPASAAAPVASTAPSSAPAVPSAAASAAAGSTAVSCSTAKLVTPGTLTVANYGTTAPDIIVNSDGSLGGLEGTIFNNLAKDCGLQLKLYNTTFSSMILAVEQHKADVGVFIYYNPARSKVLYYTYPHWVIHAGIFVRPGLNYTGPSSCKTVGTVTGFVWAQYLQKALGSNAKLFPDAITVGTALLNGQIDCYVDGEDVAGAPPFDTTTVKYSVHPLQQGDWGMPQSVLENIVYDVVACNNHPLAQAVDAELTKMVADGSLAAAMQQHKLPSNSIPTMAAPQQGC